MSFAKSNGGCIQDATKNSIKTANLSNLYNLKATRSNKIVINCCCSDSNNVWLNNNSNNSFKFLLITLALAIFMQIPSYATAAALSSASSSSSSSSSSSEEMEVSNLIFNDVAALLKDLRGSDIEQPRIRLHKRHSHDLYFEQHSAEHMAWQNPCNGVHDPTATHEHSRQATNFYMRTLRRKLRNDYSRLRHSSSNAIDISDMETWALHKKQFRFLPMLKHNSENVALNRWHRNVQVFVGAFDYLGRVQYNYERENYNSHSAITVELSELIKNASSVLCEIESAINGSNSEHFTTLTRAEMNETLKFYTKDKAPNSRVEANPLDLRFAKSKYRKFVRNMLLVLRHKAARSGQQSAAHERSSEQNLSIAAAASSSETSNSYENSIMQSSSGVKNASFDSIENTSRRHGKKGRINRRKQHKLTTQH